VVSSVNFVMIVFIISCSSWCAFLPSAEAVINPTGLSENTVVETHHSIAFFNPLGILNTYSGVQINIPSALSIAFRNSTISFGGESIDNSGSKCGSLFRSLKIVKLKSSLDKSAKRSTSFWFAEFLLALPIITSTFFFSVITCRLFVYCLLCLQLTSRAFCSGHLGTVRANVIACRRHNSVVSPDTEAKLMFYCCSAAFRHAETEDD